MRVGDHESKPAPFLDSRVGLHEHHHTNQDLESATRHIPLPPARNQRNPWPACAHPQKNRSHTTDLQIISFPRRTIIDGVRPPAIPIAVIPARKDPQSHEENHRSSPRKNLPPGARLGRRKRYFALRARRLAARDFARTSARASRFSTRPERV